MAAQVIENPDGTFSSEVNGTDVTDMTYEDIQESGVLDDWQDMEESPEDGSFPPSGVPSAGAEASEDPFLDDGASLYSSIPSTSNFTPQSWQVSLASHRALGEHYLMYAVRRTYSSSSYYWQYYLVRGTDIDKTGDLYSYSDCDIYTYYTYSSTTWYEVSKGSGTVNGTTSLVYSDLYFDYVGVDPVVDAFPYIAFCMMLVICLLLIISGRKRHV